MKLKRYIVLSFCKGWTSHNTIEGVFETYALYETMDIKLMTVAQGFLGNECYDVHSNIEDVEGLLEFCKHVMGKKRGK